MKAFSLPSDNVTTIDFRHPLEGALERSLFKASYGVASPGMDCCAATDVERRISLTAQVSDALFGLTQAPGPFAHRLETLCNGVVGLAGESDQYITLSCNVLAEPAPHQLDAVLRIAHEFVGNAVKHGMHMRLLGCIDVRVEAVSSELVLQVVDDGWGCIGLPVNGKAYAAATVLAENCGGQIMLERIGDQTIARFTLSQASHA